MTDAGRFQINVLNEMLSECCATCFLNVKKNHDVAAINVEAKIVLQNGFVTDEL